MIFDFPLPFGTFLIYRLYRLFSRLIFIQFLESLGGEEGGGVVEEEVESW